ncbi:MAG TPA: EF-hand domain-containing protein [Byssovorax sp.]|jgi:Ca2+-binding EF-hand superfamily protein
MANEQEELVTKIKALLNKKYGGTSDASLRTLFDHYDSNKDGKISDKDVEQLLKDADIGNFATRSMWIKGIVGALDKDGDKQIDWDEFSAAVNK